VEHGGKRSPAERAQPAPARAAGNYQFGWPVSGYQPGGTCQVEAPITITNHSSYLGQPYGPTPKADVGCTVNEVNGTVAMVDSDPDTGCSRPPVPVGQLGLRLPGERRSHRHRPDAER